MTKVESFPEPWSFNKAYEQKFLNDFEFDEHLFEKSTWTTKPHRINKFSNEYKTKFNDKSSTRNKSQGKPKIINKKAVLAFLSNFLRLDKWSKMREKTVNLTNSDLGEIVVTNVEKSKTKTKTKTNAVKKFAKASSKKLSQTLNSKPWTKPFSKKNSESNGSKIEINKDLGNDHLSKVSDVQLAWESDTCDYNWEDRESTFSNFSSGKTTSERNQSTTFTETSRDTSISSISSIHIANIRKLNMVIEQQLESIIEQEQKDNFSSFDINSDMKDFEDFLEFSFTAVNAL